MHNQPRRVDYVISVISVATFIAALAGLLIVSA